jgi:hypothetical protein
MIVTRIHAGLGNQLFQWALSKKLSIKYNLPVILDTSSYSTNSFRKFGLPNFPNIGKFKTVDRQQLDRMNVITIEDTHSYREIDYVRGSTLYLDGYWQSEKYFKDVSDVILESFSMNDSTRNKLFKKYPYLNENIISLLVRRGDYLLGDTFINLGLDYYNSAVDLIGAYDKMLVVSDDIEWCKENLKFKNMVFVEGNFDFEDVWLMSLCKHNIIANSTFSWWGAWMNTNPSKTVIAPKKWFGKNGPGEGNDIIPDTWIKI